MVYYLETPQNPTVHSLKTIELNSSEVSRSWDDPSPQQNRTLCDWLSTGLLRYNAFCEGPVIGPKGRAVKFWNPALGQFQL